MPVSPLQGFLFCFFEGRGHPALLFVSVVTLGLFFLVGWFHFQVFGRRSEFCR